MQQTPGAIAVAVAVTFTLRLLPFVAKGAIKDFSILGDLGRWLPLGAVVVLATYCLSLINLGSASEAAGPLAGVTVTIGAHLWKRNGVLSIVLGTTACLLLTNATQLGRSEAVDPFAASLLDPAFRAGVQRVSRLLRDSGCLVQHTTAISSRCSSFPEPPPSMDTTD